LTGDGVVGTVRDGEGVCGVADGEAVGALVAIADGKAGCFVNAVGDGEGNGTTGEGAVVCDDVGAMVGASSARDEF